jgi:hypothetical protein
MPVSSATEGLFGSTLFGNTGPRINTGSAALGRLAQQAQSLVEGSPQLVRDEARKKKRKGIMDKDARGDEAKTNVSRRMNIPKDQLSLMDERM